MIIVNIQKKDKVIATFQVEVADTPTKREKGLMYVKELPPNGGMLFVFNEPSVRHFWMKNTLIPLDMLFIDPNLKIVYIKSNAEPLDMQTVSSTYPCKFVLEIPGGLCKKLKISINDSIQFPEKLDG